MGHQRKVSVTGLGYVGLPVACAFGMHSRTIGFDINAHRVEELRKGVDNTNEVDAEALKKAKIHFTCDPRDLADADFHIVAVPTPVDDANIPDLTPLLRASETVGKILKAGDIVVYESTVYPGATEEDCVPVLERSSGLKCGKDFWVGYSPERINPGDKEHTFTRITKVVSGQDRATLEVVAEVYGSVVTAGVFRAASIKVAEAAKIIENTQRDINIALMNELSLIFTRMGIDTLDVLAAARTKWNFLGFSPGFVGGHCIGVDPYYLTYKASKFGYTPEVILSGRRINDNMGSHVANRIVKGLCHQGFPIKGNTVTVLGLTFKENVPDIRNTKVVKLVQELWEYGIDVQVYDPNADHEETWKEYGIRLMTQADLKPAHAVIVAVAHREFVQEGWALVNRLLEGGKGTVMDIKGVLDKAQTPSGVLLMRL